MSYRRKPARSFCELLDRNPSRPIHTYPQVEAPASKVLIDGSVKSEIVEWLDQHTEFCIWMYGPGITIFLFENDPDAVMFKLTWV